MCSLFIDDEGKAKHMKKRVWVSAGTLFCCAAMVGCAGVAGLPSPRSITKLTSATAKTPPNHLKSQKAKQNNTTAAAMNKAKAKTAVQSKAQQTGNQTSSARDKSSASTKLPAITHWDTTDYHHIAQKMLVPEVYHLPAGEVGLSIDDGPSPYTQQIINVFNQYHAHATFFFVGTNVKRYPQVVKNAAASGDLVEDHSMSHPDFFTISPAEQMAQIDDDAQLISGLTGQPVRLFRPPYENFNNVTEQILKRDGMALALWNRDPRDWAAESADEIVHAVVDDNPSGGVFDLHDKALTLAALPEILQGLEAQHLKIVVLPTPKVTSGVNSASR
jgi:peptidoglycan/xylan/chitin deacetylase (PgdA/CDA1 family)